MGQCHTGALPQARSRRLWSPDRGIDRHGNSYYFSRLKLGEPRQGAERPSALGEAQRGDPPNLIQLMLA